MPNWTECELKQLNLSSSVINEREITHKGYLLEGNDISVKGTLGGRVTKGGADKYGSNNEQNLCIISVCRSVGNICEELTTSSLENRCI